MLYAYAAAQCASEDQTHRTLDTLTERLGLQHTSKGLVGRHPSARAHKVWGRLRPEKFQVYLEMSGDPFCGMDMDKRAAHAQGRRLRKLLELLIQVARPLYAGILVEAFICDPWELGDRSWFLEDIAIRQDLVRTEALQTIAPDAYHEQMGEYTYVSTSEWFNPRKRSLAPERSAEVSVALARALRRPAMAAMGT